MQYQSSKGAALVISLVMLTAVTFLAVVSLQRSTLQVRMVGNTQMKEQVFHTAMSELESNFQAINEGSQNILNPAASVAGDILAGAKSTVTIGEDGRPVRQKNDDGEELADTVIYKDMEIAASEAFKNAPTKINTSVIYLGNGAQNISDFARNSSVGTFIHHKFELNSIVSLSSSIESNQVLVFTYLSPGN